MERASIPSLTDGVIQLRPLTQADAAAHLAGEDEEMAKWLSAGRSTAATVGKAFAAAVPRKVIFISAVLANCPSLADNCR